MRVLVVEDDDAIASFISRGLREAGFAVDLAATGDQGLIKAESAEIAKKTILFVVDRSGSMNECTSGSETKWDAALAAIEALTTQTAALAAIPRLRYPADHRLDREGLHRTPGMC